MKLGFVTVTMMMILVVVVTTVAGQRLTPGQCNMQTNNLERNCRSILVVTFWNRPTAACCQAARTADVECVCPLVTPKLMAALGGVHRAVRLIRGCGRYVPANFRCGSVITPP